MLYYGGKQTTAEAIVALLPPHDAYVEPFAGGLAVLLAKPPEHMEVVNDIDGDLVNFWRVLRDHPEDLITACEATPHSRSELLETRRIEGDDIERARRVWVQLTQGRSATLRSSGTGWRHYLTPATGAGSSMPMYLDGYRRRLAPAAERIRNVTLECRPALEVIAAYGHPGTVLYVDPPYLGSARNSVGYKHEMTSEADHIELLEALLATPAAVVISGYESELYDAMLTGWEKHVMATRTQNAERTEVVWSSAPDHSALFSLSMAGQASSRIEEGQ